MRRRRRRQPMHRHRRCRFTSHSLFSISPESLLPESLNQHSAVLLCVAVCVGRRRKRKRKRRERERENLESREKHKNGGCFCVEDENKEENSPHDSPVALAGTDSLLPSPEQCVSVCASVCLLLWLAAILGLKTDEDGIVEEKTWTD